MREKIEAAQNAHAAWKVRLKNAIATGGSELDEASVRADNTCDFGKWLYGASVPATLRSSKEFEEITRLHTAFHAAAAEVLSLVRRGDKVGAEASLKFGGNFSRASAKLDGALVRWNTSA